jgi:MSHA biogenesis protein MshM
MSLLYLDHFGLQKSPFKITPDLDFFFAGGRRGDVLTALLHVAQHEEGITTVVAEVGSGKTLISRLMIRQLAPHVSTVYLSNPCFSRDEILSAIARDLGLTELPTSTEAKLSLLQQELLRRHASGQRVLVVVDEAHAMPPESLEEVRLLSNLETGSHKLINIMLFGQPELDELLADRRLRQVKDRVIHRFALDYFPAAEAQAYIDHRLRAAGWNGGTLISRKAMDLLVKVAGGRARRINLMADKALLAAYAEGSATVEPQHVQSAINEFQTETSKRPGWGDGARKVGWVLAAALSGSALTLLLMALPKVLVHWNNNFAAPVAAQEPNVAATHHLPTLEQKKQETLGTGATLSLATFLDQTERQMRNPDAKKYTLQLASIPQDGNTLKYLQMVSEHQGLSMVFAQLSSYNGKKYIGVFYGDFSTVAEANRAMKELPAKLQANRPLVRTWAKIRLDETT